MKKRPTRRAEVDPTVVGHGLADLLTIYPALEEQAARPASPVRLAAFTGYEQNVGDHAIIPACDQVAGTSNVFFALPSVIVNAWRNAQVLAEMDRHPRGVRWHFTHPAPCW